jgi:hypothetical protein
LLLPLVGQGPVKMILKDITTSVTTKISIAKLPEVKKINKSLSSTLCI